MAREILLSKKTEQGLRLDPRTKLLLIFIISIFVMGGTGGEAMGLIRLVLCTVPAILLLTSKQCAKAVGYIAVFSAFYAVQIYVLPHLTGILNFLVLFTTGFFCRILPSVAIAAYAVKTTTVSELISGMERIHMPKEVTIPLTVMFRFFPTVFQESEAISDAMKMRGIKLGGKKSSKILEYKLIPMITCSVKIGEELSAAAITRGLGAPVKRTNICQLKFNFADVVLIRESVRVLREKLTEVLENRSERNRWISQFTQFSTLETLDRRALIHMVQSIRVRGKKELDITFTHEDEYKKALQLLALAAQQKDYEQRKVG